MTKRIETLQAQVDALTGDKEACVQLIGEARNMRDWVGREQMEAELSNIEFELAHFTRKLEVATIVAEDKTPLN